MLYTHIGINIKHIMPIGILFFYSAHEFSFSIFERLNSDVIPFFNVHNPTTVISFAFTHSRFRAEYYYIQNSTQHVYAYLYNLYLYLAYFKL